MAIVGDILSQTIREFIKDVQPEAMPFTRAELIAAIDAADAWADSNAASFNAALPLPFRSTASASWKALLLSYVAMRRSGK